MKIALLWSSTLQIVLCGGLAVVSSIRLNSWIGRKMCEQLDLYRC